jgi:hypothetical protein
MSIRLSNDNHESCGTSTTSIECKTIIIVLLTVMSGMDPHMISGIWGCVFVMSWLGCVEVILLGCQSVTVRLCDAIEASFLRR